MKVDIYLKKISKSINYLDVDNTYQKGNMFCVLITDIDGKKLHVDMYPINNIQRIVETYD